MIAGQNSVAFSIDSGNTFQSSRSFMFLENGTYYPLVQQSNGCILKYPNAILLVPNSSCEKDEIHVIDVSQNQYWEPKVDHKNAQILIRNVNGVIVFSSIINYQFNWSGQNKSGEKLPIGHYFFNVELDGKTLKSGSITLLR